MAIALATAFTVLTAIAAAIEVWPRPVPVADPADGDERPDPQAEAHLSRAR